MQSPKVKNDPFANVRRHLHKKPRFEHLSSNLYERQKLSRLNRIKKFDSNEVQNFFDWVFSIQAFLNLTNRQFMNKINRNGGKVSMQTLKLWRNFTTWGHLPSERNYKALQKLARFIQLMESKEVIHEFSHQTTTEQILNVPN